MVHDTCSPHGLYVNWSNQHRVVEWILKKLWTFEPVTLGLKTYMAQTCPKMNVWCKFHEDPMKVHFKKAETNTHADRYTSTESSIELLAAAKNPDWYDFSKDTCKVFRLCKATWQEQVTSLVRNQSGALQRKISAKGNSFHSTKHKNIFIFSIISEHRWHRQLKSLLVVRANDTRASCYNAYRETEVSIWCGSWYIQ